jgi:radical SAM superfamily enzyme YgiQ (UPF0313 family)
MRSRLLFLAMSGVRVRDPGLLALGLTLPGFVERSKVIASLPSLGLLTLAARTPDDWDIAYREYDELPENAAESIRDEGFGVVAISSLTARIPETYRLAGELRAAGILVILGGLHVSALPEEAAAHADIVVQGEGEPVWETVLRDVKKGNHLPVYASVDIPSPSHFTPGQPVPRYDLLDPSRYNRLTLQTTRGCPLHCSFCAASRTISPYRKKPISQIQRELEAILDIWPEPFIELADDNTFVDKRWSRELIALLSDYPIRWFTESDISLAGDPALLEALARSGCAQVLIGLESANPGSVRGIDTRNWKHRRHSAYRESVRTIQDHGITVNGCFILGFDHDDASIFASTLECIDSLGLAEVQITLLTPFPGTSLRQQLVEENRLLPGKDWEHHTLFDLTFRPARMSVDELHEGFRSLMRQTYSEERVRHRKSIVRQCLKNLRK